MRWTLGVAAALALVVAASGCGDIITVPDQGLIVTGCQLPAQCWRATCDCNRGMATDMSPAPLLAACTVACTPDPNDPADCECMPIPMTSAVDMAAEPTQCIETAQACVGRGPFCPGTGALCVQNGGTCDGSGEPPMLVPTVGMPALEPHCQFTDDVCCPGTAPTDAGASD